MLKEKIIHAAQTCDKSCGIACVAMVSGIAPSTIERWSGRPETDALSIECLLVKVRLHSRLEFSNQLFEDRVYIVAVPSLNIPGGMHYIVIDTRLFNLDENGPDWIIFDPNWGLEGKKFYTHENFKSWGELISVTDPDEYLRSF